MKIEYTIPGRRRLPARAFTTEAVGEPCGPAPRIARLLALTHKLDGLFRSGTVTDYGELARLGQISTARVSQIMMLSQLAPAIQEYILFLPARGSGGISELELRKIAREPSWDLQIDRFRQLLGN